MATWLQKAEQIRTWVRDTAGVSDLLVGWDTDAYPFTDYQAVLRLSIVSAVAEVPDRIVRVLNVGLTHDVSVSSMLNLNLQIRADHEAQEAQALALSALEALRVKLRLDSVRAALEANEIVIMGSMGALTKISRMADGRPLGSWVAELNLRTLFDYADPTSAYVFDRVQGTGNLDNNGTNIARTFDAKIS